MLKREFNDASVWILIIAAGSTQHSKTHDGKMMFAPGEVCVQIFCWVALGSLFTGDLAGVLGSAVHIVLTVSNYRLWWVRIVAYWSQNITQKIILCLNIELTYFGESISRNFGCARSRLVDRAIKLICSAPFILRSCARILESLSDMLYTSSPLLKTQLSTQIKLQFTLFTPFLTRYQDIL